MADFKIRGIQNSCAEMNREQTRFRFIRAELEELVKQMSVEELFESSISRLVQIERRAEEEQQELYRMTETLFRIDRRYSKCEERIIDHAEDVRRRRKWMGMDWFFIDLPSAFKIDIRLY